MLRNVGEVFMYVSCLIKMFGNYFYNCVLYIIKENCGFLIDVFYNFWIKRSYCIDCKVFYGKRIFCVFINKLNYVYINIMYSLLFILILFNFLNKM